MTTQPLRPDRRIQRTRQLLKQTSLEIIREKGFRAMSIQEITERANVNRGTFYVHFADKYALLHAISRDEFQHLLESKLPPDLQWDRRTVHLLIQAVLDHSENLHTETGQRQGNFMAGASGNDCKGCELGHLRDGRPVGPGVVHEGKRTDGQ